MMQTAVFESKGKPLKIAFVDPPGFVFGINTGLTYLTAVLKKHGHSVKIFDATNKKDIKDLNLEELKEYDIIGFPVKTPTYDKSVKLAQEVKRVNSRALFIAGGSHVTLDGVNFLKENPIFDLGMVGESEETLFEIFEGRDYKDIRGIIYRDENGNVVENERRMRQKNLDDLPFPDLESFDYKLDSIQYYPLTTSRGCPYLCTFCTVPLLGRQWIPRSPENVVAEIKKVAPKVKEFHIIDDNFTFDMDRAKEICRLIIKEGLKIKWSCPNGIRADKVDDELAGLMKRAGCYSVNVGIECADPDVFKTIKKGETLESIKRGISICKRAGLTVHGNFIIGLPDATFKSDMNSLRESQKMGLDMAFWGILNLFPKTEIYRKYVQNGNQHLKILQDWKKGFVYDGKFEPKVTYELSNYSKEEMIKMFYIANMRSKGYGFLVDPRLPGSKKAKEFVKLFLKYDPLYFFNHVLNVTRVWWGYRDSQRKAAA